MTILKCDKSDKENAEKYILKNGEKEIGYGYFINREINPIEIFINEEERSNGYGKLLFAKMLQVAKEKGLKALIFKIKDENYRFSNIVSTSGALHISSSDGETKWALPIF